MDLNRIPKVLNRIHAPKTCLDCSKAFFAMSKSMEKISASKYAWRFGLSCIHFLQPTIPPLQKDLNKSPLKSDSASGLPNLAAVGPIVPLLEETSVLWSQLPSSAPSSRDTAWKEEETCLPVLQQQQVLPQEEKRFGRNLQGKLGAFKIFKEN